jgi:hypothetical protein
VIGWPQGDSCVGRGATVGANQHISTHTTAVCNAVDGGKHGAVEEIPGDTGHGAPLRRPVDTRATLDVKGLGIATICGRMVCDRAPSAGATINRSLKAISAAGPRGAGGSCTGGWLTKGGDALDTSRFTSKGPFHRIHNCRWSFARSAEAP